MSFHNVRILEFGIAALCHRGSSTLWTDVTPIGLGFSGVFVYFNLFDAKFLDIAPISYKTVFLNTTDAVILLDIQRRVVDLNPAALLESPQRTDTSTAIGQSFGHVFPHYYRLMEQSDISQMGELTAIISLPGR